MGLLGKKKGPKPEEIYEAVKSNKKADVESLLAAKCDPNAFKDQFTGDVCLHLAANKGRTEIIAMLLSGGATANLQNKVRPSSATARGGYSAASRAMPQAAAAARRLLRNLYSLAFRPFIPCHPTTLGWPLAPSPARGSLDRRRCTAQLATVPCR